MPQDPFAQYAVGPKPEPAFQSWYAAQSKRYGLNPDPDAPEQLYDYRAAFKAGAMPDASGHWPSTYKKPGHPNEIVGGFNTRTGEPVQGQPQASEADLVKLGWDSVAAKRMSQPAPKDDPFAAFAVQPAPAPKPSEPPPPDRAGYYRGIANMLPSASTMANALPAIGGAIGGIAGGIGGTVAGFGVGGVPGGIGGAALGGAAGESARQFVNRARGADAPLTMGQAAKDIGVEGAIQGGAQAAGGLLAKGAGKAGTYLMNRALNLTDRLSREFPHLSQTMIDHALTVTKGGLGEASAMLRAAKGEANAALTKAHASGATVPVTAATDGLTETLKKVMDSGDIEGGLRTLAAVERKMLGGRANALTPMEADALKKSLQTQSKALYLAQKMGNGRPAASVQAEAMADMARSLNAGISDITEKAGAAGYKAANAEAAEMIGAVRGITKGIRPGANLYQAMVRPGVGAVLGGVGGAEAGGTKGAAAGAVLGGALTSPAGMSRLAITLAKPSVQAMLKQSPRLSAMLAQLMAGAQE